MTQKELDDILENALEAQLTALRFTGRGRGTSRVWERDAPNTDMRQVIVTPCAPIRGGGAVLSCGAGIRFEEIEDSLAVLTKDSNCFRPSRNTVTVGASLEEIVNKAIVSWSLIDAASVAKSCRELTEIIKADVIPWLNNFPDYKSAYNKLLAELVLRPKGGCVSAFRAFLIEEKLGLSISDTVSSFLKRAVSNDDIGADVCRKVLAK
jgi:hypothetical protein